MLSEKKAERKKTGVHCSYSMSVSEVRNLRAVKIYSKLGRLSNITIIHIIIRANSLYYKLIFVS